MVVDRKGRPGQGLQQGFPEFRAEQGIMPDEAPTHPAEKGLRPAFAFIQDIVRHHQIAGGHLLPQGPRGHPGQDFRHPQALQGIEVGPGVEEGRREVVARLAVAGEDRKLQALMPERDAPAGCRHRAWDRPRSSPASEPRGLEGLMRPNPGNDGDFWFHNFPRSGGSG